MTATGGKQHKKKSVKKTKAHKSKTEGLSAEQVRKLAKRKGITTSGKSTHGLRVAIGRK